MESHLFLNSLINRTIILFSFITIFSGDTYSQPGPSDLCILVYDKQGKLLILDNDIKVFSYLPQGHHKMSAFYLINDKGGCQGNTELICTPIIIETHENIVSIIHKNDTMNIIIKDYFSYGFMLLIDSLVFSNGWYKLRNDNRFDFNSSAGKRVLENKMNLKYDTCYYSLARISSSNLINTVPDRSQLYKNEIQISEDKKETEQIIASTTAKQVKIIDSLGVKYINYKFSFEGKEYSKTSIIPKSFESRSLYNVVVFFNKNEPEKILDIRSYPHGY